MASSGTQQYSQDYTSMTSGVSTPAGSGGNNAMATMNVNTNTTVGAGGQFQQQQPQQAKDINAATLCRLGQETVQEIISRTQEIFQTLRTSQPPDGKFNLGGKPKFQETLRNIKAIFKRLRVIYEKLEENFPSDRTIYFEADLIQKSEAEIFTDDNRNTEIYKSALEEYRDTVDQAMFKNRHLKDTIDQLRQIIWDVNTMLSMRKE